MKSVLFVSDFFIGGGLETRILEQVKVYHQHGVKCYLAADEYNKELTKKFDGFLQLPLRSSDRWTIIKNTDALVDFCKKNAVEMIDAQPMYGVIAASFASAVLHLPMSYTLHAPYNAPWLADDPLLTWFHLVWELRRPQVVLVAEYVKEVYPELVAGKDVRVVRNGVIVPAKEAPRATGRKWIFASRLSGPKAELPIKAVPVLEKAGVEEFDIFGGGDEEQRIADFVEAYNADETHKLHVNFRGWCDSVIEEILKGGYEGGIGMDRVAVEMMAAGLPVVILGYGGLTKGVSEENIDKLLQNNWSSKEEFAEAETLKSFSEIQKNPEAYNMRRVITEKLESKKIWTERLKEVESMKTDLGRDAMLLAVWQDFYENAGKTRQIEQLQAQLNGTLSAKIKAVLSR